MYVFLTKILLYVRIKLGVTHAFEMFTCEFCFHSSPLGPWEHTAHVGNENC